MDTDITSIITSIRCLYIVAILFMKRLLLRLVYMIYSIKPEKTDDQTYLFDLIQKSCMINDSEYHKLLNKMINSHTLFNSFTLVKDHFSEWDKNLLIFHQFMIL